MKTLSFIVVGGLAAAVGVIVTTQVITTIQKRLAKGNTP
jgi:predicted small secreted protein